MPAMHPLAVTAVKDKVGTMLWRHLQLNTFDMTHDECLQLIAPPEHFEVLKFASQYVDVEASEGNIYLDVPFTIDGVDGARVLMRMRTHEGVEPPLRPRHPVWHRTDPQTTAKIENFVQHRLYHGRMAATTKWVFQTLTDMCQRGEQVRYLWPSVMLLVDETLKAERNAADGKVARWKEKYGIFRAVKNAPAINPVMRKAIVETSQWLTQGLMLSEVHQAPVGPVTISVARTYSFWLGEDTEHAVLLERD